MRKKGFRWFALMLFLVAYTGGAVEQLSAAPTKSVDDFSLRLPPTKAAAGGFAVTAEIAPGVPVTFTFTIDKDDDIRITGVQGVPDDVKVGKFRDHVNFRFPNGDKLVVQLDPSGVRDGVPRSVRAKGDRTTKQERKEDRGDDDDDEEDEEDPCEDPDDTPAEQDECERERNLAEAKADCDAAFPLPRDPIEESDHRECLLEAEQKYGSE